MQTLEEDVEKFVTVVEDLGRVAKGLITRGHFDGTNISARQVCYIGGCSLYFSFCHVIYKGYVEVSVFLVTV